MLSERELKRARAVLESKELNKELKRYQHYNYMLRKYMALERQQELKLNRVIERQLSR